MNSIGIKIFLIIETVLYLGFLCLDISGFFVFSRYVKYASIFLLFLYVLIKTIGQGVRQEKNSMLIPAALAFSAAADVFLLFTENYFSGLLAFLAVQAILCARIHQLFRLRFFYQPALVIFLFGTALGILVLLSVPLDVVSILALLYFLCFFSNIVTAVYGLSSNRGKNKKANYFLAAGLILFFFCDIHVGLYNSVAYIPQLAAMPQGYQEWISLAMWLFYLPGQTLIGLSNLSALQESPF